MLKCLVFEKFDCRKRHPLFTGGLGQKCFYEKFNDSPANLSQKTDGTILARLFCSLKTSEIPAVYF